MPSWAAPGDKQEIGKGVDRSQPRWPPRSSTMFVGWAASSARAAIGANCSSAVSTTSNVERALLARMLNGGEGITGLRSLPNITVFLDYEDLTKRDLILAIGFDHLGYTDAVREYERRGVIVYERVAASIYSRRMLESFGMDGAIRVSPLHCNSVADIDRFLQVTRQISEAAAP